MSDSIYDQNPISCLQRSDIFFVNLSVNDHRILSADVEVINYVNNDLFSAFEDLLVPEDKQKFLEILQSGEQEWFPVRLLNGDEKDYFYMRNEGQPEPQYYRFSFAHPIDMLDLYQSRFETVQAVFGVLALYEDVCFMAKPEESTVYILQSSETELQNDIYELPEFEAFLLKHCAGKEQEQTVKAFMENVRRGTAAFQSQVSGDLLGTGNSTLYTTLKGRSDVDKDGFVSVYGIIHRDSGSGLHQDAVDLDFLTGALGKEDITKVAVRQINERHETDTNFAIIDIDYFKSINDTYGHKMGDEVLQKVAGIIKNEVGRNGILGRFGGDEFVVVFRPGLDENALRVIFSAIKNAVRSLYPVLSGGGTEPLTVSIGCARYPEDAGNFDEIFMVADYCLYLAKNKGRNRYILYNHEKHLPIEDIRLHKMSEPQLPARENTTIADTIINLMYDSEYGAKPSAKKMLREFWPHVNVSAMGVFVGEPYRLYFQCYKEGCELDIDEKVADHLFQGAALGGARDLITVNQLSSIPESAVELREYFTKLDVQSFVLIRFKDASGRPAAFMMGSVHQKQQWNSLHFRYYRLFVDVLKRCDLE